MDPLTVVIILGAVLALAHSNIGWFSTGPDSYKDPTGLETTTGAPKIMMGKKERIVPDTVTAAKTAGDIEAPNVSIALSRVDNAVPSMSADSEAKQGISAATPFKPLAPIIVPDVTTNDIIRSPVPNAVSTVIAKTTSPAPTPTLAKPKLYIRR